MSLARITSSSVFKKIVINDSPQQKKMLIKGAKTQIICWTEGLRPFIRPYHVLVMDNAKIHRTDEVKDWALREDVSILFLSPYSPDLSPMEFVFGLFKAYLKDLVYVR